MKNEIKATINDTKIYPGTEDIILNECDNGNFLDIITFYVLKTYGDKDNFTAAARENGDADEIIRKLCHENDIVIETNPSENNENNRAMILQTLYNHDIIEERDREIIDNESDNNFYKKVKNILKKSNFNDGVIESLLEDVNDYHNNTKKINANYLFMAEGHGNVYLENEVEALRYLLAYDQNYAGMLANDSQVVKFIKDGGKSLFKNKVDPKTRDSLVEAVTKVVKENENTFPEAANLIDNKEIAVEK